MAKDTVARTTLGFSAGGKYLALHAFLLAFRYSQMETNTRFAMTISWLALDNVFSPQKISCELVKDVY